MKRFLGLLIIMFAVLVASAQTVVTPTEAVPDSYIYDASYVYVSDSLTNVDTTLYTFRVKGTITQDFTVKLYLDWVSGTAGGVLTMYKSIDGVNYAAIDTTITATGVTADIMDTETIELDNFNYPYLKAEYIQSGTAVTRPKIYLYTKRN
jgi:hypothetical protein